MVTHTRFIVRATLPAVFLFAALSTLGDAAEARAKDREGKEVVDAVCVGCHGSGKDGAPRIGDVAAWSGRASQGLTALTENALKGIRKMPAHGGDFGVSDVELQRAIVHMVNSSGGRWIEPARPRTELARTSESIVQGQCAACHKAGTEGAPKIGDRAAWTPRLAKGLDNLVASAAHGHGPMPARGGIADLENEEIRGAIVYMFNNGQPPVVPPPETYAADPRHKQMGGTDIYFGVMRADAVRASQGDASPAGAWWPKNWFGLSTQSVPSGKDYYHLNISLSDHKSGAPLADAQVTLKVSDGLTVQSKTLPLKAAKGVVSYGEYFRLSSGSAYTIQAEIRRPTLVSPIVASFDYRAP